MEIKYRAWHTVNEVMYPHKEIPVLLKNAADDNVWKYMQYSDLNDMHNCQICQGDILMCFVDGDAVGNVDVVEIKNGCFWLRYRHRSLWSWIEMDRDVEVIGNVHQHLHLLS